VITDFDRAITDVVVAACLVLRAHGSRPFVRVAHKSARDLLLSATARVNRRATARQLPWVARIHGRHVPQFRGRVDPHGAATAVPAGGSMYQLLERLKSVVRRDEGQDLLEYALLIALIAIVCVAAITLAGTHVRDAFNNIAGSI
jgi:pilus assembly protein Flp/PilA